MKERPPNNIAQNGYRDALDCRDFVKCMAWAGTGVIWSINGGLLTSTVFPSVRWVARTGSVRPIFYSLKN